MCLANHRDEQPGGYPLLSGQLDPSIVLVLAIISIGLVAGYDYQHAWATLAGLFSGPTLLPILSDRYD
jgi:hypothetical protein